MILKFLPYLNWGVFILRIVFGVIFLAHGWPKLVDLKKTWLSFNQMGFKPGKFWGTVVVVVEVIGGILMIFGIFTQLVALIIAVQMIVATLWKIKNGEPFIGGYEFDLLLVAAAIAFMTLGAGSYSIDLSYNIQLF